MRRARSTASRSRGRNESRSGGPGGNPSESRSGSRSRSRGASRKGQTRLVFPDGHGGNRKHDWAERQRRRGRRVPVPHRSRGDVRERHPLHLTMRVRAGLESLRSSRSFPVVRDALRDGARREGFRLNHFSVQSNHLHLIVEAEDRAALARGMIGLATRMARRLNRLWRRRGAVFAERYHSLALRSGMQVKNALRYVLNNVLRHAGRKPGRRHDPCSSGAWFDGWRTMRPRSLADPGCPIAPARGFLLRLGWRRHGLLGLDERPVGAALGAR